MQETLMNPKIFKEYLGILVDLVYSSEEKARLRKRWLLETPLATLAIWEVEIWCTCRYINPSFQTRQSSLAVVIRVMKCFGQMKLIWSLFKVTTIFRKPKLFTRLYASDFIPGLVKLMSLLLIADENLF